MSDTDLAFRATLDGSGFASGAQALTGHLNTLGIQTNSATANLGSLGTVLGTMANPATAAALAITSVGAGLAASVNVAGDFQQKMAGVNAIVGGSAADMQTLSDAAREAGASTSFSASQAADALGFMAGAGWSVQQSTQGLQSTLTLAAAGGMDLAQAGDMMTNTVSQFGLAATDSGRVANVLAAGASATNTSVSQLGEGMKVVGATANAFGMSLESTTAALGSLSNAGIKGSEGGTALRGALASLATQTGPAAAALAELGLTAADVNPETVSLSDSMSLLQERGMTATQAIAIFGRENVSAATYMAAHASELDGLQTSITGTSKASEMAAIQTATYQGAMGELSSAVEEAEIALGSVLLPVVTQTVQLFTEGVTATTNFGKAIYDAFEPTGSVGSVFAESDKWLNETFGFYQGDAAATNIADGIKENKDLQTATGDTLGSDASKKATKDAAADSAKEFSKEWVQAFEIAQNDREIAKILARGASLTQKETDEALRTFDYLGEQFALKITSHTGSAIGDWYSYSLRGGDTVLAQSQASGNIDPIEAFTMATGLPAPAVGTEAYYRLLGDDIAAEKAKLQAQIKEIFDYSGINSDMLSRLENEGEVIGKIGSDKAKDAYATLLDNFREPAVEKLGEVLDEINTLAAERPLAASEYQLFGEEYKARLYASISDMASYLTTQMEDLRKKGTDAFSDSFFSDAEKSDLMGKEPWLEYLKQKSPEEFAKAGGDSWLKFIDAIKKGASSSDLEKMFSEMGQKSGKSFTDSLTGAVHQIQGKPLSEILKGDLSEIGNMPAWIENTFNPGLKASFDEMYDVYKLGYDQNIQLGVDWVDEIESTYLKHSDWFEDWQQNILAKHVQGQLTEIEAIEAWHAYEDEAAKKANEKQDEAVTSAGMFYGELVDQAAKWTDYINGEGGFVGPTALYDDFRKATDPNKALSAEINAAYNVGTIGSITSIQQAVTIDTSSGPLPVRIESIAPGATTGQSTGNVAAGGNVLDQSQNNVNSSMSMTLAINMGVRELSNTIRSQSTLLRSVMQASANALSANMLSDSVMVANATSSSANAIIATLYAIFSGWAPTQASGVTVTGNASAINSTQIDSYASGGYVANPTIALIGDAPGGEYIVPAMEYQRLFERQTMNLQIDGSAIQKQISDVVGGITIEPVVIPARVEVDFDSSEIQAAIHRAIATELESMRI